MIVKNCKKHGSLTEEQVYKEKNKKNKCGYYYRCHQCKLEKDINWKANHYEQYKESACRARNEARRLYREGLTDVEPKANKWCREDRKNNPEKYRQYDKNYYQKHGRLKVRRMEVARIHGISLEEYISLFELQIHKCKICGSEETRKGSSGDVAPLCVDHCHLCRENGHIGMLNIRGLLCHECNKGLGGFKDNPDLMKKAIEYLEKHKHIE